MVFRMRERAISGVLTEFIVIVAGVLAALGVDQWRQSRVDLLLERELLQSLAQDLVTDSTDFARLPTRALGRVVGAEVLLRTFRPSVSRPERTQVVIDTLTLPDLPASDEDIVDAFSDLVTSSDLDVAVGAYQEFAEGGGQRLVRNRELRRLVHDYRYRLTSSLKYDPVMLDAIMEVQERAHDLALSPGDTDAAQIRARLRGSEADPFFAAVRTLQRRSVTQHRNGWLALMDARELLEAIQEELD
jgi:hypothetical protein